MLLGTYIFQKIVYGDEIATFITNRVFTLQIGLALIAPGVFQLILEHGVIMALWEVQPQLTPVTDFLVHFSLLNIECVRYFPHPQHCKLLAIRAHK